MGLTGGIGAGKSTVAAMLAERGALIIDTDVIAREVVEPGGPAYDQVVRLFGPDVLSADGSLDRARLAAVAFTDPASRAGLNAAVHPAVAAVVRERLAAEEGAGARRIVVLVVPLLVEAGWSSWVSTVVVVDCPEDVALRRLVESRGMDAEDVRRRMGAQATREERLAEADLVVTNDGTLDELEAEVDRVWSELLARTA